MIRGPGKSAGIKKNKIQPVINNRKLFINIDEFLHNRNKKFNYTSWNNNKLTGFALLKPDKNSLKLELLVTKEGYRAGSRLLNKIKLNSKGLFKTINLISLPKAQEFYKKQGFVPNGTYGYKFIL